MKCNATQPHGGMATATGITPRMGRVLVVGWQNPITRQCCNIPVEGKAESPSYSSSVT